MHTHLSIWSGKGLPGAPPSDPTSRGEEGWPDGDTTLRGRRLPRKNEAMDEPARSWAAAVWHEAKCHRQRCTQGRLFAGCPQNNNRHRTGVGPLLTRLLCRPGLLLRCKCARGLAVRHTSIRAAGRNAAAGTGAPAVGPGRQAAFRRLLGCLTPCAGRHCSHTGLLECCPVRLAAKHAQR